MRAEDFDKATIEELQAHANRCFDLARSPLEEPLPAHRLGASYLVTDEAKLRLLLEGQFYTTAVARKRDEQVANRDFKLEIGVIVLIGLEIILSVAGIGIGIHEANAQAKEMSAQTGILNQQASQAATAYDQAAKRAEQQLGLAQKQVSAAQDSVKAIQRQMMQDQRPWVSLDLDWPSLKSPSGEPIAKVVQVTENQPLSAPMRISNSGKTAAKNVYATIFIEVVDSKENPHIRSSKAQAWRFEAGALFPNAPSDFVAYRQEPNRTGLEAMSVLTPTENQELRSGQAYLAIFGRATYDDVFKTPHWTRFCFWLPMTATPAYYHSQECSKYNAVDSN